MPNRKDKMITEGPIGSSIIKYTVPLVFGNLISILFNAADIAILGNYADKSAVAAVGATSSIVSLLVSSFIGISAGTNVMISRFIGSNDEKNAKKCVDTSIVGSFVLGIILAIVGVLLSKTFLRLTDCPEDIIHDADVYLKYYFCGIPAMMVYNFGATIIRASGNSKSPLLYLAVSGALNVALNFILCIVLDQKVVAVAVATLVSQCLGAFLVMIYLVRERGACRFDFKSITFSMRNLAMILKIGLPCALNSSLFSISNLQIQSAINKLGADCIAGNTVAGNVEGFVGAIVSAFATSTLVFVSQNYGANNPDRINKTILFSGLVNFIITLVLGNSIYIFGESVFSIYLPGEYASIEFAMKRASYLMVIYWVNSLKNTCDSATQAYGYSIYPMITSIASILGLRVLWMLFIYPMYPYYGSIMQCYSISWGLALICSAVIFALIHRRMLKHMR